MFIISERNTPNFQIFLLLLMVAILYPCVTFSQQRLLEVDRQEQQLFDNVVNNKQSNFHSSIQPYIISDIDKVQFDSVQAILSENVFTSISKRITSKHLIELNKKNVAVYIDPLINTTGVYGFPGGNFFSELTGGLRVGGDFGKMFSVSITAPFTNAKLPHYIDTIAGELRVIPGQGFARHIGDGRYYCSNPSGYLSFTPSKHFNIIAGHDKNFIGDGYRSLILSDNANNYSFIKLSTTVWKFKYVNIFANLKHIMGNEGSPSDYANKFGAFHYLDMNIGKRLSIGIFETIIWQGADSSGRRGFDINYLNPVIFYRPVEFSVGSPDNALMGLNFKFMFIKKNFLYGQIMLDEFKMDEIRARRGWWANKQGFQLGLKGYDLFGVENLSWTTEFNYVRPFTYAHHAIQQNYAHFNQPLAHPLGANFREFIFRIHYRYHNWFFETSLVLANYGADTLGSNFGKDVYQNYYATRPNDFGNKVGQGINTTLSFAEYRLSYLVNQKMNLRLEAGMIIRQIHSSLLGRGDYYSFFGLRTTLRRFYRDI